MYILQVEVSETIPVSIPDEENKSKLHTMHSLYDVGNCSKSNFPHISVSMCVIPLNSQWMPGQYVTEFTIRK